QRKSPLALARYQLRCDRSHRSKWEGPPVDSPPQDRRVAGRICLPQRHHVLHGARRCVCVALWVAESGNCELGGRKTSAPRSIDSRMNLSYFARRCILYIMRRTQLYLEEDLWTTLHAKALLEGAT